MVVTVLGLDLGCNSVGWALLRKNDENLPAEIIAAGVRIFEAGLDGDIPSGNAESRCVQRRMKRMARRLLNRRRRRLIKVKHLLQRYELLPQDEEIGKAIPAIDAAIIRQLAAVRGLSPDLLAHTLPYHLRALALDQQLDRFALGRALYHLAQRRGFLSNRKESDNEETGKIKKEISELEKSIAASGARTLGEYFSRLDPRQSRIRTIHTSRQMFIDEFNRICDAQSAAIPPELRDELYQAIFFQRKLKSTRSLIGECSLEKNAVRCPWYRPEAQKFRYLQTLNNLRISIPGAIPRDLSSGEWMILNEALDGRSGKLDKSGNLKLSEAKKLLQLSAKAHFSIEEGGEKNLRGHQLNAIMFNIFGPRWNNMTEEEREKLLQDLHSFENTGALLRRIEKYWGLSPEKSAELAKVKLPADYCMLSRKAICKLLPDLEEGIPFQTAVKKHYPDFFRTDKVYNQLPPLQDFKLELRNPAVSRTLSQVRKVVNAVIGKYGKPDYINVELARDMKNSTREKKKIIADNRNNEIARNRAQTILLDQMDIRNPSRDDIDKVLLWEECGGICPYTGRPISMSSLFGATPQFDIEHIIPYSRCLDNSFANKTLCWHEENRLVKRNRTPDETYSGDTEKYARILQSVSQFQGRFAARKKELFRLADATELDEFSSRQLNDTRYATKAAMQYLSLLYGGLSDAGHTRRIQSLTGGITALVRKAWGMNRILGDGEKNRHDHRHHAVDAVAIAMTGPALVKKLTDLFKNKEKECYFNLRIESPLPIGNWPTFLDDLRSAIAAITVSHAPQRKIGGALHEETIYSRDYPAVNDNGKPLLLKHVRKRLDGITAAEVEKIVDPVIRQSVADRLLELNIHDPKKAFADPANLPQLHRRDGTIENWVKYVKITRVQATTRIGEEDRAREVVTGSNHHMEIVAILDSDGNESRWEGYPVSMLDAVTRLRLGQPVVQKDFGPDRKFKFSLCLKDTIEVDDEISGTRCRFVINCIDGTNTRIWAYSLADARTSSEREKFIKRIDPLRKLNCRKITVSPLGEVRWAND